MDTDKLTALARAVKDEIEKRHKRRGYTTGRKLWELRLLQMANDALVEAPQPKPDKNQMLLPLS